MDRRLELEKIIIGTILNTNESRDYFQHCRYCLTGDMFRDEVHKRIFVIISEMYASGNRDICPLSIVEAYGEKVRDIIIKMVELSSEYDFMAKKTLYNERQYLLNIAFGMKPNYTDVHFKDYIDAFINEVLVDGKQERRRGIGESTAA